MCIVVNVIDYMVIDHMQSSMRPTSRVGQGGRKCTIVPRFSRVS